MPRSSASVLAALMATLAYAQSSSDQGSASVTTVFLPGVDSLPYVASMIGESGDVKTLAISCGPGVDSDTCGFPSSVTAICGPSTAYISAAVPSATFEYDCKVTGGTAAVCAETFQGDVAYIATESGSVTPSGLTSTVTTETLASSDISYVAVTITAGGKAATSAASASGTQAAPSAAASSAAASSAAVSVPTAVAPASESAAIGGSQSWESWGGSSQVVQSQSVATASVSSAQTVPATSGTASTTTTAPVAQYTGAAAKFGAIGNYAAGLLALAGMAL